MLTPNLIQACIQNDRKSQKELYRLYYGFALRTCLRYAKHKDEAIEVVNDGFMKVFRSLDKYKNEQPFQSWLNTIMINTAIDHYRKRIKQISMQELNEHHEVEDREHILSNINYEDLIKLVQRLSYAYRTVFNLFAIDGYSHEEIAKMLNISTGTSKSNLFKAREQLKGMLTERSIEIQNSLNPDYGRA